MVLFTSQILLVLATSPLSWTGSSSGRFSIIGYSLGGGIATAFTSHFPELVSSLVTIAPAGLLRPHHIGRSSRLIYSEGVIPESVLNFFVRRRLKTPLYPTKPKPGQEKPGLTDSVAAEMPNLESSAPLPLSKSHPDITIESAVSWQVDNHEGFVPAFMSSIRHGPITEQHDDWRVIGRRLTQQAAASADGSTDQGLEHGKVLIITGNDDVIIKKDEIVPDATAALEGNVVFSFIDAGHEAPIVKSQDVVRSISEFWNL
jgi:pimeloyl-ACP methyl ester carboxylesterase